MAFPNRPISAHEFESGLRLDQYVASLSTNKENFRAAFMRAIAHFSSDDLAFFRALPGPLTVLVLADDASPDTMFDVPIVCRLSVEVSAVRLRLFRPRSHADVWDAFGRTALPVIAFFAPDMRPLGTQVGPLVELAELFQNQRETWIEQHPEVADARAPVEAMSAMTRTRLNAAAYALPSEQRDEWGRATVRVWRAMLETATA